MPVGAEPPDFGPAAVAAAFPFHLVIEASLQLRQIGSGVSRIDAGLRPGAPLAEHFTLIEPRAPLRWELFAESPGVLFCFQHRKTGLELRGEMIVPDARGPAVFLGSSWLTDPAQLAEFGLSLDDLASDEAGRDAADELRSPTTTADDPAGDRIDHTAASDAGKAIIVIDAAGRVDWVNDAFTRQTGCTLDSVRGRPLLRCAAIDAATASLIDSGRARPAQAERGPAIQFAVARCLADATGTADALARIVDALPACLDWRAAALWTTTAAGGLAPGRHWPKNLAPPAGANELAAGTLAAGVPRWVAAGCGNGAAFALPVHSGTGTIAVIACFNGEAEAEDAELMRLLSVIGGQIAQFVARQNVGERLRRLTSELSAIFQLSPDGFVAFDEAGVRSYINPAFLRMTGLSRDELEGVDEAAFEARLAALCDSAPDAETGSEEGEVLHLARPRPTLLRRSRREARDADGRLFGRILYFRDITRETELARLKSEFLSTAAHELRTPMASIHGFTELLLRREFDAEQRRDIHETILRQCSRLVEMVNELLDLARIEARAGRDFNIVRQPLVPVIEAALGELLVANDPRRVEVKLPKTAAGSPLVEIDRDKFIQALTNVLSNAYKYSPQGGAIALKLRRRRDGDTRWVGVAIRDHGIGMSEAQLARVFERFFRADPTSSIPGTGLGMSLVKEIMDFHEGSTEIVSTPGVGTEITLWLRALAPDGGATAEA